MTRTPARPPTVGTLCIVLHTHLPWVAGHGTWPVGEEWLHQAWSAAYLPLVEVLGGLAAEGRRNLLSLGVTPVLAAQLDDPRCLREQHGWLARWQLRAHELATRPGADRQLRDIAALEHRTAAHALELFESTWRHGGSAALRPLVDAGAVELLGGPATHPVLPLLPEPLARLALTSGLDDTAVRLGRRPRGAWLPECAVGPGLDRLLSASGVDHVMVDEATLVAGGGSTDRVGLWGDVAVVGRDLALTDLVWSSRSGFPGGADYRDFHHLDDGSGFRTLRVTSPTAAAKAPYDPTAASALARRDAARFAAAVRDRLLARTAAGEQPLAVVAWDTELFGHWWHEGPQFLGHALRMLPEAGVRLATLAEVTAEGRAVARPVDLPVGSWGHGKDLRLWAGPAVADLAADQRGGGGRAPVGRTPQDCRDRGRSRRVAGRLGPRGPAADGQRLGLHGLAALGRGLRPGPARGAPRGVPPAAAGGADGLAGLESPPTVRGRPAPGRAHGGRRRLADTRHAEQAQRAEGGVPRRRGVLRGVTVSRITALLVLTAAFAPAAVMGALPVVAPVLIVVCGLAMAVTAFLQAPEPATVSVETAGESVPQQ